MEEDLLGMSNEELIQWAFKYGRVNEKTLRKALPDIELFCAQHPISTRLFVERLIAMTNHGIYLPTAIGEIKRVFV